MWPYASTEAEIKAECARDAVDESWRRTKPGRQRLIEALRAFCRDHERSGMACEGLNAAYFEAKALLRREDVD